MDSNWKLVDEATGEEITMHDSRTTFRGEPAALIKVTRFPDGNSNGKILVQLVGQTREFYPSVIGAKFVRDEA